jgi:hypothetical protein
MGGQLDGDVAAGLARKLRATLAPLYVAGHSPDPSHNPMAAPTSARRGRGSPARSASVHDMRMMRSAPRALI